VAALIWGRGGATNQTFQEIVQQNIKDVVFGKSSLSSKRFLMHFFAEKEVQKLGTLFLLKI
jgi:hypothetical protein